MDDGTSRQGSWKGEREREKSSEASQNSPLRFAAEVNVDSFTKWPSDDLQAQTVCRALGRLSARPENHSFVWRSAADMPESAPCYGRVRQKGMRIHPGKRAVSRMRLLSWNVFHSIQTPPVKFGKPA